MKSHKKHSKLAITFSLKDIQHTLIPCFYIIEHTQFTHTVQRGDFPPQGAVSIKRKATPKTKIKITLMSELSFTEKCILKCCL